MNDNDLTIDPCGCWSHDDGAACGWCGTWAPPAGIVTLAETRARFAALAAAIVACDVSGDTIVATRTHSAA